MASDNRICGQLVIRTDIVGLRRTAYALHIDANVEKISRISGAKLIDEFRLPILRLPNQCKIRGGSDKRTESAVSKLHSPFELIDLVYGDGRGATERAVVHDSIGIEHRSLAIARKEGNILGNEVVCAERVSGAIQPIVDRNCICSG